MALEDFFTLTEMKDGLATVARVQELVSILGKQKHCTVTGIFDQAKEWSTVFSVLAATGNRNCLDHFIRLGGLCFLSRWIMHSCDAAGGPLEETISLILGALERLPLKSKKYKKKFISSGIGHTMKHLLVVDNLNIQESARLLLDKWDVMADDCQDEEKHVAFHDNELKEDIRMSKEVSSAFPFSDDFYKGENGEVSFCTESAEETCQKNSSASYEPLKYHAGGIGVFKCKSPSSVDKNVDFQPELTQRDGDCFISNCKGVEMDKDACQCQHVIHNVSSTSGYSSPSLVQNPLKAPDKVQHLNCKEDESALEKTTGHQANNVVVDSKFLDQNKTLNKLNVLENLTGGELEDFNSSFCEKEVIETCRKKKEMGDSLQVSKKVHSGHKHCLLKSRKETNISSKINRAKPENENGEDDEGRVTNADREHDSSSIEGNSDSEIEDCSSSKLRESRCSKPDSPPEIDHSFEDSCPQEDKLKNFLNTDANSRNPCNQETLTDSVQEFEHSNGRSRCSFDLNEVVCTDEFDCLPASMVIQQKKISAPVAVIASSKGTHALLGSPFHFKGESGWRGSAATSAFRRASPRRTPDGENTASGLREKAKILKIDLNLTKDDNEEVVDPILENQIPDTPLLPSGESSVEVTSAKAERLKLDLNRVSDENMFMNSSPYGKHSNRSESPSPASSSSTKQPSMRDIDLNNHPNFIDSCDPNSLNRYLIDTDRYGRFKQDDPVNVMGSRMAFERQEHSGLIHLPILSNTPSLEQTTGDRPMLSYPQAPAAGYGYNETTMGQPFTHSPGFYGCGPFPHMVDSRVLTVVPQLLGSLAASNGSTSTQPFLIKATGSRSPISQPRMNLNKTILSLDGGANKDLKSLKQFFMQDHDAIVDGQTHPVTESSAGLKRKYPDRGWENFPIGYNQGTSWQ